MKKKVLFLGASGRIGPGIIEEYLEKYLSDYELIIGVHSKKGKDYGLKTRKVDVSNLNSLVKAMKGIDVVINLAANSNRAGDAKFDELLKPNIIGAYNVFEAARKAKCERVIFASSIHSVQGYERNHKVLAGEAPRPDNLYGATKAFGEALCNVFSANHDLSCLAIRIGAYTSNEKKSLVCVKRKKYDYVITQRDLGQLIHKCIIAPKKLKYGILGGISNDKKKRLGLNSARKLVGYEPEDDAYKICKEIKSRMKRK
tara:strand:+ start:95 stop:865 length:771 start_codon:yes stop_codon:yes gene_type:complete